MPPAPGVCARLRLRDGREAWFYGDAPADVWNAVRTCRTRRQLKSLHALLAKHKVGYTVRSAPKPAVLVRAPRRRGVSAAATTVEYELRSPRAGQASTACSSRAQSSPTRRQPRRTQSSSRDGPDRPSDDPERRLEVCRCGCGEPIPAGRRRYVDDAHSNRARQRRFKGRERAGRLEVSPELLERASLALNAIRRGSDPYLTLSVAVWPPETADEAREILGVAA
jgi:hypothetical protein